MDGWMDENRNKKKNNSKEIMTKLNIKRKKKVLFWMTSQFDNYHLELFGGKKRN